MEIKIDKRAKIHIILALTLILCTAPPAFADELPNRLAIIAKHIVDSLIGIAAVVMAVGIAYKALKGQLQIALGSPYALSQTWTAIAGIIICFIIAAFTVKIANLIIDLITSYAPGGAGGELSGVVGTGLRWAAAFCAFWLAVGIATGATEAEIGYATDNPWLIHQLAPKIIGLTMALIVAIFAPRIAALLGAILGV